MQAVRKVLTVGAPPNRLLRFALFLMAAVPTLLATWRLLHWQVPGTDLLIPLSAAQRWVDGGQPYLASSFEATSGLDLPFLYPPFVLPLLVPLLALPRELVVTVWVAICLAVSIWALRMLRVPVRWMPAFLVWAPFAEGIVSGNVGVLAFAFFVALFFESGTRQADLRPISRDPTDPIHPGPPEGIKATLVAALKVAHFYPLVYMLLRRPRAALTGIAALGLLILATLPFTGLAIYGAWLEQLARASDPDWIYAGNSLTRSLPSPIGVGVTLAAVAALWFVPRRDAGPWVGVLTVVGAASLHTYGFLFLVPVMLRLRRELALIGAMFIGFLNPAGIAIGSTFLIAAAGASILLPGLREPDAPGASAAGPAVAG